MADHNVIPFQFETHTLSVITDEQGDPWWIAGEVCAILELPNVSKALSRLDADQKTDITLSDVAGRPNKALIINESGLYTLVLGSRKKSAKVFRRWVTDEVLPQIRKTGQYQVAPADPLASYPELKAIRELILAVAEARDQAQAAEARAMRAEVKADLALEAAHTMTVEEFVLGNRLLHQFPPSTYKRLALWLSNFCQQWGLEVKKAPVYGKSWDNENAYPLQAFGALLRAETKRPKQITLVKPSTDSQ